MYTKRRARAWHAGRRQRWENRQAGSGAGVQPEQDGRVRRTFPAPGDVHTTPVPISRRGVQNPRDRPQRRHQRLQQLGPPTPGPGTWRRAEPAAPRGRTGQCRRRALARAASRGLGRRGRPPHQETRRTQPPRGPGTSACSRRRHPPPALPSSRGPAPT